MSLENYWTEFYQTFSIDAFWEKDERFNFRVRKVKGQGHEHDQGPGEQRQTELVF